MTKKLRIVMAQLNLIVGDIAGNLKKHLEAAFTARDKLAADIIVYPELGLTGYPPEDLLLRRDFIETANQALEKFIHEVNGIHCLISHPLRTETSLHNACSLVFNGKVLGRYAKQHLPNYGVFDEKRYFTQGNANCVVTVNDVPVGLVICEDLWFKNPTHQAAAAGARIILSPNASPFETDKHAHRIETFSARARENRVAIVYVNNVGGQDELIFDGGSMCLDDQGHLCHFAGFFNEALVPVDIEVSESTTTIKSEPYTLPKHLEMIYQALILSVRDYYHKNHFKRIHIGVSGGIDSALTLAIAVDAVGRDNVEAIIMPSRYTSTISMEEAHALITNLGVASRTISIEPTYEAALESLKAIFTDTKTDITEENMQARVRATLLMALSNKFKSLVLTTGNRSELAVGYCTLYGDMAGGFAVLKDIPKSLVYDLAEYRNTISPAIPPRTITRAPTAELRHEQKDEDSLPPYSILDQILYLYLNEGLGIDAIVAQGFDRETVTKVIRLVIANEYKRSQAAIGPRINHTSFGKDWRYPLTNGSTV